MYTNKQTNTFEQNKKTCKQNLNKQTNKHKRKLKKNTCKQNVNKQTLPYEIKPKKKKLLLPPRTNPSLPSPYPYRKSLAAKRMRRRVERKVSLLS